ncbi:MAG TPA: hypothetical protein VNN80_36045, partial [Polyangiaceae bacterium]|nr:hypothetical protein [Polyangiaceae bacterium]
LEQVRLKRGHRHVRDDGCCELAPLERVSRTRARRAIRGYTGVPTNVDLWVLATGWGDLPRASLAGVELARLPFGPGFDLGELQPNTSYTVEVELADAGSLGATRSVELSFTTGAGPAPSDPGAAPGHVEVEAKTDVQFSPLCGAVLQTQDCFDTGQDTHLTFSPSGTAEAWLIESESGDVDFWPAECGAPDLFLHSMELPCVTLHGIDAAGAVHGGEPVCPQTLGDLLGNEGGCGLRSSEAGSAAWRVLPVPMKTRLSAICLTSFAYTLGCGGDATSA